MKGIHCIGKMSNITSYFDSSFIMITNVHFSHKGNCVYKWLVLDSWFNRNIVWCHGCFSSKGSTHYSKTWICLWFLLALFSTRCQFTMNCFELEFSLLQNMNRFMVSTSIIFNLMPIYHELFWTRIFLHIWNAYITLEKCDIVNIITLKSIRILMP